MNVLNRYFGQPDELPDALKTQIVRRAPNQKILVYAFCDLNEQLTYAPAWLVATEQSLIHAVPASADTWQCTVHAMADIEKFEMFEGISSCRIHAVRCDKSLALKLHFSRRQSRAIGSVQFVVEQRGKARREKSTIPEVEIKSQEHYTDDMLQAVSDAKAMLATPTMGVMLRLLSYLKPYKRDVVISLIAGSILTLLYLLPPYLTRVLIDDIVRPLEKGPNPNAMRMLMLIIGSLAATWATCEFLSFIRLRLMSIVGEKVAMQLRATLYGHLQKLSLSFFSQKPTGSLITRVSSDTDRLWDFITMGALDITLAVLQIVGVMVALLIQDWSLALLVLIPIPIMAWMFWWHSSKIQTLFLRIWRKWSSMTSVLSDVIPGMRVVKAFAQEDHEISRFEKRNKAVRDEAILLHREWTRFWPTVVLLMHACTLIVWVVGAPRVMRHIETHGAEGMPLGLFIAFTTYMWMFWEPVQRLGMMSRTINRVTTSASRIFEVLDTVPTIVTKPQAAKKERLDGSVVFDNAVFSYDGVRNTLKGVSFDVKPGEMIGLVGPSGGGKTTLVNLICRFYDVKAGRILVDGIDVRDHDLPTLRRQVGVVLQEPYLFHGTIADNIMYGAHNATQRDIIEAARAANAHDFVCGLPDGYQTLVGERGQTLSGGERQRISIARAILHNPRLLILDEATSSVDTETEKRIQEALRRLVVGRTTFAIAHRLSTLAQADRLFVLEDGNLAESGTHSELLAKPEGVYAKLHRTQMEMQATMAV